MDSIYTYVNQISWFFAVIDEQLRNVDRTSRPIYSRIDIVMSSEFCTFENCWQKLHRLITTATRSYRQVLKNGIINIKAIKNTLGPYIDRINYYAVTGYKALADIYNVMGKSAPNMFVALMKEQKSLMDSSHRLNTLFIRLINSK